MPQHSRMRWCLGDPFPIQPGTYDTAESEKLLGQWRNHTRWLIECDSLVLIAVSRLGLCHFYMTGWSADVANMSSHHAVSTLCMIQYRGIIASHVSSTWRASQSPVIFLSHIAHYDCCTEGSWDGRESRIYKSLLRGTFNGTQEPQQHSLYSE